MISDNI